MSAFSNQKSGYRHLFLYIIQYASEIGESGILHEKGEKYAISSLSQMWRSACIK